MGTIIELFEQYSAPIILMIAFSSAVVYVLKLVIDKTVSTHFDRYTKEIELRMNRRSEFEQKVLLDRYELVSEIANRIERVTTDLNRARHGAEVKGLFDKGDIVPLTEIFEDIASKRYLLTEQFYQLFLNQCQVVLKIANAKDKSCLEQLTRKYLSNREEFTKLVNEVFGIDKISW